MLRNLCRRQAGTAHSNFVLGDGNGNTNSGKASFFQRGVYLPTALTSYFTISLCATKEEKVTEVVLETTTS